MDYSIIAFGAGLLTYWFYENMEVKKRKKIDEIKSAKKNEKLKINPPVTITIKKN